MQRGEVRNPVTVLLLYLLTCGVYACWYLFFVLPEELNQGLGREEYNGVKELLLSIVTCGLWSLWYMWRASESVVELQQRWGVEPVMEAPILFLMHFLNVGSLFMQQSLNNAWEHGTPGGGAAGF